LPSLAIHCFGEAVCVEKNYLIITKFDCIHDFIIHDIVHVMLMVWQIFPLSFSKMLKIGFYFNVENLQLLAAPSWTSIDSFTHCIEESLSVFVLVVLGRCVLVLANGCNELGLLLQERAKGRLPLSPCHCLVDYTKLVLTPHYRGRKT
jgi:hypothetical protein